MNHKSKIVTAILIALAIIFFANRPLVPSVKKPLDGAMFFEGKYTIVTDYSNMKLMSIEIEPFSLNLYTEKDKLSRFIMMRTDRTIWLCLTKDGNTIDLQPVSHRDEIDRIMLEIARMPGNDRIYNTWYPTNFALLRKKIIQYF